MVSRVNTPVYKQTCTHARDYGGLQASMPQQERSLRSRPARPSRSIFVLAAGRRSRPPQPTAGPQQPSDVADARRCTVRRRAATAVRRRPTQPTPAAMPSVVIAAAAAVHRRPPWHRSSSRAPHAATAFLFFPVHGFTPQTKQSTASIVGSHWSGSNPRGGPGRRDHLGPVRPGTRVC